MSNAPFTRVINIRLRNGDAIGDVSRSTGASISQVTDAVAIVVSESSMVRVFDDGKLVAEIIPELWLMDHYNVQLSRPYQEERVGDLAVLTAES